MRCGTLPGVWVVLAFSHPVWVASAGDAGRSTTAVAMVNTMRINRIYVPFSM